VAYSVPHGQAAVLVLLTEPQDNLSSAVE